MQKEYSAIKITNPIILGHLVRLYPNQKIIIVLNDINSEINVLSDFLIVEKRDIVYNQLICIISQKYPQFNLKESIFFMGEIYIYSKKYHLYLQRQLNDQSILISPDVMNG